MRRASWIIDGAGIALCVALTMVAYFFGVGPRLEQKAALAAQRQQLRERRRECRELEASVTDLEARLAVAQEQLAAGQIQLEPFSQTNGRVARLAALLTEHGLEIDDVRIGNVLPSDRCTVVPINIAGRGDYHESVTLLREFTRTFADTSVAKLEFVGNPADADTSHRFRLELLWYTAPALQASGR
ncbi:MAG: type 4a pilus biogenesis protein PilO [Phycisphaerales bacterium]|nr:MAG: type 4a pilus biogenesis protein PilO [Phycisphaerales bacterium]